jgi:hypothetical protein
VQNWLLPASGAMMSCQQLNTPAENHSNSQTHVTGTCNNNRFMLRLAGVKVHAGA